MTPLKVKRFRFAGNLRLSHNPPAVLGPSAILGLVQTPPNCNYANAAAATEAAKATEAAAAAVAIAAAAAARTRQPQRHPSIGEISALGNGSAIKRELFKCILASP